MAQMHDELAAMEQRLLRTLESTRGRRTTDAGRSEALQVPFTWAGGRLLTLGMLLGGCLAQGVCPSTWLCSALRTHCCRLCACARMSCNTRPAR